MTILSAPNKQTFELKLQKHEIKTDTVTHIDSFDFQKWTTIAEMWMTEKSPGASQVT